MAENPSHELVVSPFNFVRDLLRRGTADDRVVVEGPEPGFLVCTSVVNDQVWKSQKERLKKFLEHAQAIDVPRAGDEFDLDQASCIPYLQWLSRRGMLSRALAASFLRAVFFFMLAGLGFSGVFIASFRKRRSTCTLTVLGGIECAHKCLLPLQAFSVGSVVLMLLLCVVAFFLLETLIWTQLSHWLRVEQFFETEEISLPELRRVSENCEIYNLNTSRTPLLFSAPGLGSDEHKRITEKKKKVGLISFLTRGRLLYMSATTNSLIPDFRFCSSLDRAARIRALNHSGFKVIRYVRVSTGGVEPERCFKFDGGWDEDLFLKMRNKKLLRDLRDLTISSAWWAGVLLF